VLDKQKEEVNNLLTEAFESGTMTINTIRAIVSNAVKNIYGEVDTSSLSIEYITSELMQTVISTLKRLSALSKDNISAAAEAIILVAKRIDKNGNKIDLQTSMKLVINEIENIFIDFGYESFDLIIQIKDTITLNKLQKMGHIKAEVFKDLTRIVDTENMNTKFYNYIKGVVSKELQKEIITPKRVLDIGSTVLYGAIDVTFRTRDLANIILVNSVNAIIDATDEEIQKFFSKIENKPKDQLSSEDRVQLEVEMGDLNDVFAKMLKSAIKKSKDEVTKFTLEELSHAHGQSSKQKPIHKEIQKDVKENANIVLRGSKTVLKTMFKPMQIMATPITKMSQPLLDELEKVGDKVLDKVKDKFENNQGKQ